MVIKETIKNKKNKFKINIIDNYKFMKKKYFIFFAMKMIKMIVY